MHRYTHGLPYMLSLLEENVQNARISMLIYCTWGMSSGTQENCTLKYVFVTLSQCPNVKKERAGLAGRQVMGTLQVHAVILSVGGIVVKDTTLFLRCMLLKL
jgi:hypothetical protein